jgi:tol-pal system protein YbgF
MFENKSIVVAVLLSLLAGPAAADYGAPVVDLSQGGYAPASPSLPPEQDNEVPPAPKSETSALPLPDRMRRVEQQVDNLVQMNLPGQITDLQQQLQQLRGELQELTHQMDVASRQQQHVEALPAVPPMSQTPPNPAILNAAKPPTSEETPAMTSPQTDATAYQQAFNLLSDKQYEQSAVAFKEYLRRHPDGQFVANAHYWLGDIYFQQKNLTQAELELNLVVAQYAASGKAPDAQFKLAMIHAQQGKTAQARQELRDIMTRYPGSSAAQLASVQLQQLNTASPGQ